MATDMPTHIQLRQRPVQWAKNWKKYEHLLAFPYDILAAPNPLCLLEKVASCDEEVADWRKRMIGRPFRPNEFVKKLESFL